MSNTFETSSKILVFKGDLETINELRESVSNEQRRSKLEYSRTFRSKRFKQPIRATALYDAQLDRIVEYPDGKVECRVLDRDELITNIYGFQHEFLVELLSGVSKHLVGPTGLVLAIDAMKDRFSLDEKVSEVVVGGFIGVPYRLEYKLKSGELLSIRAVYAKVSLSSKSDDLPMRVTITMRGLFLTIIYARPQALKTSLEMARLSESSALLDPFSIRPLVGCAERLEDSAEGVFGPDPYDKRRFSFKAGHSIARRGILSKLHYYVAYDPEIDSMSFDLNSDFIGSHVRHQIYNFKLNRMYSVAKMGIDDEQSTSLGYYLAISRQDETSDAMTVDTQCIINLINPEDKDKVKEAKTKFTLGRLVSGADRYVYLGKAIVRGISARVYEAAGVNWPFWIEQAMAYQSRDGNNKFREPNEGADPEISLGRLSSLIYFVDNKDAATPKGTPLMIQIFMLVGETRTVHQTIDLYDFAWYLDDSSPKGYKMIDLFSLADSCSQKIGGNQYARIDLLLEGTSELSDDDRPLLENPQNRNLAVMGALQNDLKIPSTMIYDLQSKLIRTDEAGNGSKTNYQMFVSFRVAEHVMNIVNFLYLGQGRPNGSFRSHQIVKYRRSFQSCAMSSAHMRRSTHFGYNPRNYKCVTERLIIDPERGNSSQFTFIVDASEEMELYRVEHTITALDRNSWINGRSFTDRTKMAFLNSQLTLRAIAPDLKFQVQHADIDTKDYKSAINSNSLSLDGPISEEKIAGFGLIKNRHYVRHVSPISSSSDLWTDSRPSVRAMSFDLCRISCLRDQECNTFSVCALDLADSECLVTSLKLNKPHTLAQFYSFSNSKPNGELNIDLNGTRLDVIKNPHCDIYSKQHIDLFNAPSREKIKVEDFQFYKGNSRQDCALKCLENNFQLDKIMQEQDFASKNLGKSELTGSSPEELSAQRKLIDQFCLGFSYISEYRLAQSDDSIQLAFKERVVQEPADNQTYAGYCGLMQESRQVISKSKRGRKKLTIKASRALLKFELFYDRIHGLQLRPSPPPLEAGRTKSLTNDQVTVQADIETCARLCYLQLSDLNQSCRSFDVEYVYVSGKMSQPWCHLNSLTLRDITASQSYEIVDDTSTKENQKWHFEPLTGYLMEESVHITHFIESNHKLKPQSHETRLGGFYVTLITVFGLISGLCIAFRYGEIVLDRLERSPNSRAQIDAQTLIINKTIELHNSVNAD